MEPAPQWIPAQKTELGLLTVMVLVVPSARKSLRVVPVPMRLMGELLVLDVMVAPFRAMLAEVPCLIWTVPLVRVPLKVRGVPVCTTTVVPETV